MTVQPIHLSELATQRAGQWVGLRHGQVIEVRETFDQLALALHEKGIKNVTVMRVPAEHEAELVGLG